MILNAVELNVFTQLFVFIQLRSNCILLKNIKLKRILLQSGLQETWKEKIEKLLNGTDNSDSMKMLPNMVKMHFLFFTFKKRGKMKYEEQNEERIERNKRINIEP